MFDLLAGWIGSQVERWFGRRNTGLLGRWLFTFLVVVLFPASLTFVLAPARMEEVLSFGLPIAVFLCWLHWLGRKR